MIIANPIYDVVFKRLMEDKRVAKFFIETLLEEPIEDVEFQPQEYTFTDELAGLAVYRLDFIATIKLQDNTFKKVLIEIQKARNAVDLMRFRKYLGEQYKKEDEIQLPEGIKKKVALPIITIYLLGFTLPDINSVAVKVQRQYTDLDTHEIIHEKSDFIEKLTNDCFVVQLPRIKPKVQSRLQKLLSVFEQNYFTDENAIIKEYIYDIDDETIRNMLDILHFAGTDPKRKKEIEDEQEAWRVLDNAVEERTEQLLGQIDEMSKELGKKDAEMKNQQAIINDLKRRLEENGLL